MRAMPEKEPLFWQIVNQIASVAYVVVLSSVAGAIGYMNGLKRRWQDFSYGHLLLSLVTGGFNGYLMFLLCDVAEWSWQLTAFMTGAAGAMGSEMLNMLLNRARIIMGGDNGDGQGKA